MAQVETVEKDITSGLKLSLDMFNGLNARAWLQKFESFLVRFKWDKVLKADVNTTQKTDIIALYYMEIHFEKNQLAWLKTLTTENKASWPALKEAFTKKYISGGSFISNELAFSKLRKQPNQSVDDFYLQCADMGELVQCDDKRLSAVFLSGLEESCRFFCLTSKTDSSLSYLEMARLYNSMKQNDNPGGGTETTINHFSCG